MLSSKLRVDSTLIRVFKLCTRFKGDTKNIRQQQLKPKTPDDEYQEMFQNVMKNKKENSNPTPKRSPNIQKGKQTSNACPTPTQKSSTCKKPEEKSVSKEKLDKNPCEVPKCPEKTKKKCPTMTDNECDKSGNDAPTMNALVLDKLREMSLKQVPIPTFLKKDEVIIQVAYAGINSVDVKLIEHEEPPEKDRIPGREFCGVICGVGDDITHVKAGDAVCVAPCLPYTMCQFCCQQKACACVKEGVNKAVGVHRDGGWAEFSVVPANVVYKIPDVPLKNAVVLPQLAQIMCSMARLKLSQDSEILIQGCGLFGSICALLLQRNGFERVSICEDNPLRVKHIEALCTGFPIVAPTDLCDLNLDVVLTNGAGADAMQKAVDALNQHGQFVVIGPTGGNGSSPKINLLTSEISRKQIHVFGMIGTPSTPSNISAATVEELVDYCKLGISLYPMEKFKEGLTKIGTGDANYVVLEIQPDI